MKILEEPENSSSPNHFNSAIQSDINAMEILQVFKFIYKYLYIIQSFSAEEGTNSTCLTVLVTAKPLEFGVVGLANVCFFKVFFNFN